MPILDGPKIAVHFTLLSEEWAMNNHGQTLARLAQRGGLGVSELWANMERKRLELLTPAQEEGALTLILRRAGCSNDPAQGRTRPEEKRDE